MLRSIEEQVQARVKGSILKQPGVVVFVGDRDESKNNIQQIEYVLSILYMYQS